MMKMNDKMFQDIIDDPTISTEEKMRMILEDNWKENFKNISQEKDIEVVRLLNKKIVTKFYKDPKLIEKVNFSDSEDLVQRLVESLVMENGEIKTIIGKKLKINNEFKELYRESCGEDFDKEVEKTKRLIMFLNKYQNFFINTAEKRREYKKILQSYQQLTNKDFINFRTLKESIESL